MDVQLLQVLGLALLPPAGNFAGALLAERRAPSGRMLNWALHAASGVLLAIVAVELMPRVLQGLAGWWIAAAVAAGGLAYLLIEAGVEARTEPVQGAAGGSQKRMWMIFAAVAVDLTSDGLMLGAGAAVATGLGVVLALGQVLADIPEGYATLANFRDKGVPRRRRLLLTGSLGTFCVGAALIAYLALRGLPEPWKLAALAFVAGILLVASVEDMIEEAHEAGPDSKRSVAAFIGGFALFTLVSAGLESVMRTGGS